MLHKERFYKYYPNPGWVEHDANEIWGSILAVIASVLSESGVKPYKLQELELQIREKPLLYGTKRVDSQFIMPLFGNPDKRRIFAMS